MRSTLLLVFVALNAWMTAGLPVRHSVDDQLAAQGITLKYRSSPAGVMENPPHFSDWSQEERNKLRISMLEAGGKGVAIPAVSWAEKTQQTFKALWTFYHTQYPTKSEALQRQKNKRPKYFTAIEKSRTENEAGSETSEPSDEQQPEQSETAVSGLGFYLSHFSHMDPAIICNKFTPEIIGLCIFLLVPAAVMIVEVIDMLHDRWTPEQFPERGRGRERLTGVERQYTIMEKYEREKAAMDQSQKWWGQRRRSK